MSRFNTHAHRERAFAKCLEAQVAQKSDVTLFGPRKLNLVGLRQPAFQLLLRILLNCIKKLCNPTKVAKCSFPLRVIGFFGEFSLKLFFFLVPARDSEHAHMLLTPALIHLRPGLTFMGLLWLLSTVAFQHRVQ